MKAVIFRAQINELDDDYFATAARMRELAMSQYGCVEFHSVCEGDNEVSISYWYTSDQIRQWAADPEHQQAQQKGRDKWYRSYRVEITDILRTETNVKP
ncbi:MAG: antibiotic biosynthesis monooxygenase [Gammaproteobacteria bacterium]|nr:antibiotic biosynthesis monooxygenase [Gammaproteobacteria bacterium]